MSDSVQPHRRQPTRLPRLWDSPGKNTGVGCHVLLQCMNVKSESEVAQSCPTLHNSMDCSPPGSAIHGIFQARVLEWGAIAFSVSIHSHHYICILTFTQQENSSRFPFNLMPQPFMQIKTFPVSPPSEKMQSTIRHVSLSGQC